jgi:hypothetical protein
LISFEVDGWHNLVHLASGVFLLAMMGRHDITRLAAVSFGAIYGVVTVLALAGPATTDPGSTQLVAADPRRP